MSYLRASYEIMGEVRSVQPAARTEHVGTSEFDDGILFVRPAWQADAACRSMDPDLFFGGRGAVESSWAQARATCAECPVRVACLEFGMREKHGMWGGLSERERRRLRRERKAS